MHYCYIFLKFIVYGPSISSPRNTPEEIEKLRKMWYKKKKKKKNDNAGHSYIHGQCTLHKL